MFSEHWCWQCFLPSKQHNPMTIWFQIEWRLDTNYLQKSYSPCPFNIMIETWESQIKLEVKYSTTRNKWVQLIFKTYGLHRIFAWSSYHNLCIQFCYDMMLIITYNCLMHHWENTTNQKSTNYIMHFTLLAVLQDLICSVHWKAASQVPR